MSPPTQRTSAQIAEPYTQDDLEELRACAFRDRGGVPIGVHGERYQRLLATIDALRSQQPVPPEAQALVCGGCRCPAPCIAHPELTACDAPPLNVVEKKKWDELTVEEQARQTASTLWGVVQRTHPRGETPTVEIGYLFAGNVCGVLRKAADFIVRQAARIAEAESTLFHFSQQLNHEGELTAAGREKLRVAITAAFSKEEA